MPRSHAQEIIDSSVFGRLAAVPRGRGRTGARPAAAAAASPERRLSRRSPGSHRNLAGRSRFTPGRIALGDRNGELSRRLVDVPHVLSGRRLAVAEVPDRGSGQWRCPSSGSDGERRLHSDECLRWDSQAGEHGTVRREIGPLDQDCLRAHPIPHRHCSARGVHRYPRV